MPEGCADVQQQSKTPINTHQKLSDPRLCPPCVRLVVAEREEVEAFLEAVNADDDVQNVYVGLAG